MCSLHMQAGNIEGPICILKLYIIEWNSACNEEDTSIYLGVFIETKFTPSHLTQWLFHTSLQSTSQSSTIK